jgi:hypothetical protein
LLGDLVQILIETVNPQAMRYATVGDWFYDADGVLHIQVAHCGNGNSELIVAVHELVEALLCRHNDISEGNVTEYDKQWNEQAGLKADEPGNEADAPYHKEHTIATAIEMLMASHLDVNWAQHEDALDKVFAAQLATTAAANFTSSKSKSTKGAANG